MSWNIQYNNSHSTWSARRTSRIFFFEMEVTHRDLSYLLDKDMQVGIIMTPCISSCVFISLLHFPRECDWLCIVCILGWQCLCKGQIEWITGAILHYFLFVFFCYKWRESDPYCSHLRKDLFPLYSCRSSYIF